MKRKKEITIAHNIKHKGNTLGYKATVAFDMILLFLKENQDKTTKNTTLQDFQRYITKHIEEFNTNI